MKIAYLTAMATVATVLTIGAQAHADTLTFLLNTPECTGTCSTLPASIADNLAIIVTINRTSNTSATVTFTPPGSPAVPVSLPPLELTLTGHTPRPQPMPLPQLIRAGPAPLCVLSETQLTWGHSRRKPVVAIRVQSLLL